VHARELKSPKPDFILVAVRGPDLVANPRSHQHPSRPDDRVATPGRTAKRVMTYVNRADDPSKHIEGY
jgi:hypothetical protein